MTEFYPNDEYCAACEMESFSLIEHFIFDIQHLSSEVVRLRYMLSRHLPKEEGDTVRTEIFSDLYGSYYDYPAYKKYISTCCNDIDPMNSEAFEKHLKKTSIGKISSAFRSLTF